MNQPSEYEQYLDRVVTDSFALTFNVDVQGVPESSSIPKPRVRPFEEGSIVHILGDWNGSIVFESSNALLRGLSGKIYEMDADEVSADQCSDLLREIVNLLGGNLKTVLGKRCILSTPKTLKEVGSEPGIKEGVLLAYRTYLIGQETLAVRLVKNELVIPVED
ncbi:MAG: chemotaxis protein CheX [Bdellovibrionales bacterium]|nr:chemotaxis protein CheX [Bdellovibrionales bacterium]